MFRSFVLVCLVLSFVPSLSPAQGESQTAPPAYQWKKTHRNPIIPAVVDTWLEEQTAGPDLLLVGNTYHLYFCGQKGERFRIGFAPRNRNEFTGDIWDKPSRPVVDVGGPGSPDEKHCLNPATVRVKGRIFMYYMGVNARGEQSICLAESKDGVKFTKYEKNPVLTGGSPEVVYSKNTFYLYFLQPIPGKDGFQVHYATSKDGYRFSEPSPSPVVTVGGEGSWDSYSVETPRIFSEGGLFYMLYCGSDRYKDYPWSAGLATSTDLVTWKKYEGNPVFKRGYPGTFDEGAIWSTTVEKIKGRYYMYYRGQGGGDSRTVPHPDQPYLAKSQIGVATLDAPYFYVKPPRRK